MSRLNVTLKKGAIISYVFVKLMKFKEKLLLEVAIESVWYE